LLDLRLGRACSAFVTGAALALAGVMMQALLRNPLADPYVLGISSGAAVGALAALLAGAAIWLVDLGALCGAVGISLLLFMLARRDLGGKGRREIAGDSSTLLLTGVILAAASMALVTLMLSIAPESRLRGMVFWMIGDLSGTQWRLWPWLLLVGALLFASRQARALNVMALHADGAATLGVNAGLLRRHLFIVAALLTAGAVSTAGSIGFVGLIVPHAIRYAFGPDHRLLLPAATLAGGTFLVMADTLARTVLAPQQLPVGVLTSLIGVPIFLFQLHQLQLRRS
jgi:iron complex transport system permease protein